MSLSPQFLDELRARTQLSALIGRSVKISRAGREWKACCPFHEEKTPSFTINDAKGFYHCFGCGAHGDAIRWMTDQRGLAFMDAVKELAGAAGMDLPAPDPRAAQAAQRRDSLHDVMAAAQAWFVAQLAGTGGAAARAYLDRRGIGADLAARMGFGFAPDARGALKAALARFGEAMLVEAGLLIAVDDKDPYDRFRGRLMLPIRDARGRTIAFGGRTLGDATPKYLNSPDTPLFDKGRTLYHLDGAAPAARASGRLLVVEGYMDAVALVGAGIAEVVAPLGTALTEMQLELAWRQVERPMLCFDGDAAGQRAALRAATRALPLLKAGQSLDFVTLPAGQDPDDVVRHGGAAAIEALITRRRPMVDMLWDAELAAAPCTTPEDRAGLRARLNARVETIGDAEVRRHYAAAFRERFDRAFFARPLPRRTAPRTGWTAHIAPPTPALASIASQGIARALERTIIIGLLRHPLAIARHWEALAQLNPAGRDEAAVLDALLTIDSGKEGLDEQSLHTILAARGVNRLARKLLGESSLPFTFSRGGRDNIASEGDGDRAIDDLGEVVRVMVERRAIEAAMADTQAEAERDLTQETFEEQQRLREALSDYDRRLRALQDDDGTMGRARIG